MYDVSSQLLKYILLRDGTTSLIEEAKEDLPVKPDLVVGTIGGGGLLCGVVRGLEKVGWADVPFLGMETLGCNSYNNAVKQGKLVSLGSITRFVICAVVDLKILKYKIGICNFYIMSVITRLLNVEPLTKVCKKLKCKDHSILVRICILILFLLNSCINLLYI